MCDSQYYISLLYLVHVALVSMVTGCSIATLVIFVWTIVFVIHLLSIPLCLPYIGHKRLRLNLTTAPILAIAILWAAQCLGPSQAPHTRHT
ncbi:hypothetical protein B0H11DRAFT_2035587 [Mycena galericulata]|nr:hypothetical protein B0H11DRAFT_2035587 [Mycena galericulata]